MLRMSHEATSDRALATPRQASPSLAMAPHLSLAELDLIAKSSGALKAPKDIHALISAKRRARKVDPPPPSGPGRMVHNDETLAL